MSKISQRACHLVGIKDEDLNRFVHEVQSFLLKANIPEDYKINVYKDQITCCGHMPVGVAVEIEGPKEQPIKNLDQRLFAKIIEICEREGIESHVCDPLEIL